MLARERISYISLPRLSCRSNADVLANTESGWSQQLQDLGIKSASELTNTVGQWTEAHKWALLMFADAVVTQGGGINASQSPQKMLLLSLALRTTLPSTRNPSLMFQLKDRCLLPLEAYFAQAPAYSAEWERGAPIRTAMNQRFASRSALHAGLLPVMLNVEGFQMIQLMYFPQTRPDPMQIASAEILASRRQIILEDILIVLWSSINLGFPLRFLDSDSLATLLPGRFVRDRDHRNWTWEQLFPDWSQYQRGQHQGLDGTLDEMQSGLFPSELMFALKSLVF